MWDRSEKTLVCKRSAKEERDKYHFLEDTSLKALYQINQSALNYDHLETCQTLSPIASGCATCNTDAYVVSVQLYWPDDELWYLVEIHSVSSRQRSAK